MADNCLWKQLQRGISEMFCTTALEGVRINPLPHYVITM